MKHLIITRLTSAQPLSMDDFGSNNGQKRVWSIMPKYGFKEVIALQGHYRGSLDHLEIPVHLPYINSQLDPSSHVALFA